MSFVLLGILNSQAAAGGFGYIQTLGTTGAAFFSEGIASDSSGNVYAVLFGGSPAQFVLVKYNPNGDIQWQRALNSTGQLRSVVVDSSDNIYICGTTSTSGAGGNDGLLAKYNSSGTIQWQRTLGLSGSDTFYDIALNSSGDVYVVGTTSSQGAGNADNLVAKYNSSGTIQWQRILGSAFFESNYSGIGVDGTGDVFVTFSTPGTGAGGDDIILAKYNSSGTIQFQKTLGGASGDDGKDIAIDSDNNIYVFGDTESGDFGNGDLLLVKYNLTGTVQWQAGLGLAAFDRGYAVTTDSLGNIYGIGQTLSDGAGDRDFLFAKWDSSGTIQWQRTLGGTGSDQGQGIAVDPLDNLYVTGRTSSAGEGTVDMMIALLANDGSSTGTFDLNGSDITYEASNLTAYTPTLTEGTSTLTAATSTLTSATGTLTTATPTLTANRVDL